MANNSKIDVRWTGKAYHLCYGDWILTINGKDFSSLIPFRENEPAGTFGTYECHDIDGTEEYCETYESGWKEDEWIEKNRDWLSLLPVDSSVYPEIYAAFQAKDWRHKCCGGCI